MISSILICFFSLVLLWILCVCIRAQFVAYSDNLTERMRQADVVDAQQQQTNNTQQDVTIAPTVLFRNEVARAGILSETHNNRSLTHPHDSNTACSRQSTPYLQQIHSERINKIIQSLTTTSCEHLPFVLTSGLEKETETSETPMETLTLNQRQSTLNRTQTLSNSIENPTLGDTIPHQDSATNVQNRTGAWQIFLSWLKPGSSGLSDENDISHECTLNKMEDEENSSIEKIKEGGETSNKECPICLESYIKGDLVSWSNKTDSCKHIYHTKCIMDWLIENDECPMCRQNIIICGESRI